MSEEPKDNLLEAEIEGVLRECKRDELYEHGCKELAKVGWKMIEEVDPENGLIRHVMLDENGLPVWVSHHADKGVAALVFDAFLAGAMQMKDEVKEENRDLLTKLARWHPPTKPDA